MRKRTLHLIGRPACLLLAAGMLASSGGAALAGDACTGTYSTSLLQEVPLPVTIALAEAPVNPGLANQFIAGLRYAGAQIDQTSPLRLDMVFTVATPASGPLQGTVYNNFTWADQGGSLVDVNASTVNLMAHLVDTTSYAYIWIATAQCTIKVRDGAAVASELGAFIGRTLGRDVPNGRL